MDFNPIIDEIHAGEFDSILVSMQRAIQMREEVLREGLRSSISIGDVVRFNTNTSPKYLHGLHATVRGFAKKNITVEIVEADKPYARRYARGSFRTPVSLVDLVET